MTVISGNTVKRDKNLRSASQDNGRNDGKLQVFQLQFLPQTKYREMGGHKSCKSYTFAYSEIVWSSFYSESYKMLNNIFKYSFYKQYSNIVA